MIIFKPFSLNDILLNSIIIILQNRTEMITSLVAKLPTKGGVLPPHTTANATDRERTHVAYIEVT